MSVSFPISGVQPAGARYLLRSILAGVPTETIEIAELLTSELVANALVHGSGDVTLAIDLEEDSLRVEVHDFDPTLDLEPLHLEVTSNHGRGLAIVEALASSWGIEQRIAGKAVWFIVDL
jgi:anti-sigma regulatory factor (Ser/Thr protein kinase)